MVVNMSGRRDLDGQSPDRRRPDGDPDNLSRVAPIVAPADDRRRTRGGRGVRTTDVKSVQLLGVERNEFLSLGEIAVLL